MKKIFGLLILLYLFSCDDSTDNNQVLPFKTVDFTVNLNLAEGINLRVNGGQEEFEEQGLRGVLILRRTETIFDAYDMACPHVELQACSRMTFDALFMTCPCDGERFQLINDGVAENGNITQTLRNYKVVRNGDILSITN